MSVHEPRCSQPHDARIERLVRGEQERGIGIVGSCQFLCLDLCFPGYGLTFLVVGIQLLGKKPTRASDLRSAATPGLPWPISGGRPR